MTANGSNGSTIGDIGEFGLIDQVREQIGHNRHILIGSGDDAAHISTNDGSYVVSTDLLVEGRHFRRDWSTANDVGRKAAASNLSDINAMGGVATALTVGFGAPADLPVEWALEMVRGFEQECGRVGAHIVGGDVTASDSIIIAVTAMGDAPRPVRRSGAVAGDVVAVNGDLGLAAAGFATLSRGFRSPKAAVEAHRVPHPPYAAGPQAARAGATAMTDISDGLVADLGHIAVASGVAIDIDSSALVIPEAVATVGEALGRRAIDFVLAGGDSYALVATFGAEGGLPPGWTRIGEVAEGAGVTVDGEVYDGPTGHQHFR
ncbi:thiamine-phosphate kinase [Aeromicrobium wangtongii]|uniref:Thiamine-monophosphate kinase n=1 Tax=Aeromicrobium wangtongii TaxID=2969247 RepID=A0ABY5M9R0_9ACTN|nr:thiamine-phosphate kinase [Aeromicrobium wangtongii]MCD9197376.1 thiamine-phosphate kinase [Aeromicrobium wangtongii]UUP14870.1 thiamine-phosphate kinase [Aeromicrobium wangtongii]